MGADGLGLGLGPGRQESRPFKWRSEFLPRNPTRHFRKRGISPAVAETTAVAGMEPRFPRKRGPRKPQGSSIRNLKNRRWSPGFRVKLRVTPLTGNPSFPGTSHTLQFCRFALLSTTTLRFSRLRKVTPGPLTMRPGSQRLAPFSGSLFVRNSWRLLRPSPSGSASGSPSGETRLPNRSSRH